ncbi:MAG: sulfatase-like hydrolase/transferase [Anaerolineaceae bacterium]|nr:sulfatase-like hydrolase/transferase [Anaerolineaceae bacterium]
MPTSSPPNLLFIVADQLGARWTALDGHPLLQTPQLSALARESTVFTQACSSSPLCTPWRACMLTGRWPTQTGVTRNGQALPDDVPTLAQRLNDAGYHTAWLGKWHLGGAPQRERAVLPEERGGFRRFAGWESHHVDHWRGRLWTDEADEAQSLEGHESDALTVIAQDWLPQLPQPFCLFVSYQAPHPPCMPPPEYLARYAGRDLMVEPNVDPSAWYRMPQWDADYDLQTFRERYYGEITQLDAALGRLLATLKGCGLADRTALFFTSDHGEMNGAQGLFSKGVMYDESLRVPLLVRLPGQKQGRRCATPVGTVDFLPTLLELAGAEADPDAPGRSLLPALRGGQLEEGPLFSECGELLCVLLDGWKLVAQRDQLQALQLFDTRGDPWELDDSLAREPGRAREMLALLDKWLEGVDRPSPQTLSHLGGWEPFPQGEGL